MYPGNRKVNSAQGPNITCQAITKGHLMGLESRLCAFAVSEEEGLILG